MALDIGIGDGTSLIPVQGEPSLYLEDDGYYWFLHPLFERLCAETRQYIDLYGDASFFDGALTALEQLLVEARDLIESQPETWQVDVYNVVRRDRFLELIARWEKVIARARELGRPVVCFGD
jgi:hypothetical protein